MGHAGRENNAELTVPFLIDAHHIGARQTGNETWIRNVCRELAQRAGSDDYVFATTNAGAKRLEQITGRDPALLSSSAMRRLAIDLPRLARRSRANALLVQYTMPTRSFVPCVVMVHDTSFEDPAAPQWMSRRTARRIKWSVRASARKAARLLAPSNFTRDCLVRFYGVAPDAVVLAPNAVDPDLAAHLDTARAAPTASDTFRVLAVGNVLPRKNLVTLAAAVATMRSAGEDASLRIVGTVPDRSRALAADLRTQLGSAVTFTGYVDDAQLAAEYLAADALGFPSLYEGFGIPALEAMYAGVPVVASDSTCLPEIVGEAGVCVAPHDVAAWAAALRGVRDDPGWADELKKRGRQRAAQFTWSASAGAVLDALRASAGHRPNC